jgi:6-pyruvoyltetrahydropterin/6-carboxytetrahydropterin synthase
MRYELSQKFFFEAAHTLDRDIGTDSSRRIHGHTYHAQVVLSGAPDAASGMVVDLGVLKEHIETVRDQLDHRFLDEVPDLGPATLENLCAYIYKRLAAALPNVVRVAIERPASGDRCQLIGDPG